MDSRRDFLKKAAMLSGGAGLLGMLPPSIQKALAIDPKAGTTFMDAEHVVLLMQENRSFDHCFGTLKGVRGFNDPRAIDLPGNNKVWLQTNRHGETYAPFRLDIKNTRATWMSSLPHSWENQVDARNGGKYNGWLEAKRPGKAEYRDIPMTMGYYTREDIPFYYALADAFTVCDQHFCSSLTGTTPNRLFFWTGTLREDANSQARVRNENTDYDKLAAWKTFPERLEEHGVSWKIYQNEISVGVGFQGEEDSWLSNFTDNPIEWFEQYNVKLSAGYIKWLQDAPTVLNGMIADVEKQLAGKDPGSKDAAHLQSQLKGLKSYLVTIESDQKVYTKEKYDALSPLEKNIHDKAFAVNSGDPHYHELATLEYEDGTTKREVKVPKGDVLHQFREDVKQGTLPTVSWLVAPENFSDHPGAPWYGAWYLSEVLDILTQNPEVWKKTVFILTYDENDGCFDHVPPFVAPHPSKENTGKVSKGIDTSTEHVSMEQELQHYPKDESREGPVGLGYRVPMVIASPWTRGGWVCSEVFDHTSCLQFLETFVNAKSHKNIREENISSWRRTICGDLTSAFRPYNGEKTPALPFHERDVFIESIHKAKFKNVPDDYKLLSAEEIARINQQPSDSQHMPLQEKGTKPSNALPYEFYVESKLTADKKAVEIHFEAANTLFGKAAAGAPFVTYAPGSYRDETCRSWNYAVSAGDKINDDWALENFEDGHYHLRVYGPNGFYREFKGASDEPQIETKLTYEISKTGNKKATGNLVLFIRNHGTKSYEILLKDESYKAAMQTKNVAAGSSASIKIDLTKSHLWYDFSLAVKGHDHFAKRYAGRVETGNTGTTDPLMGGTV